MDRRDNITDVLPQQLQNEDPTQTPTAGELVASDRKGGTCDCKGLVCWKVEAPLFQIMSVRRPLWAYFIPATPEAQLRRISVAAPTLLFGIGAFAVLAKQSYYRPTLAQEADQTWDRIERRAYVALPDGRMAQVHPRVDAVPTICGLWNSVTEALSLLP